ncbi:DUF6402 family protein [Cupriavidus basilensis]
MSGIMEKSDKRIPFFEQRFIKPLWALRHEQQGCTIEDVDEFYISTERPAPPLRDQPPSPPAPPKPKEPKRPPKSLIEGFLDFREWLNTPPPPRPTPPPAAPEAKKPRVKPFDLQDIPGAMDRIGWPMSAKVMRKWLSGELNYANTDKGAVRGINQDGKPFPPSMIDTTMFQLDWILSFPRARKKYDELANNLIFNSDAEGALRAISSRHHNSPYYIDAWDLCDGNFNRYHKEFQFQLNRVDSENTDKFLMFLKGAAMPNGLLMDDLYGSLGAFSFYAALNGFYFDQASHGRTRLMIKEISFYMKDVFTFHDRTAKKSSLIPTGTQYLGHWNNTGFIIVPAATMLGEVTEVDWVMRPVAKGGIISDKTVYYPVRNKDYRAWQLQHNQGGDLILYSNRKIINFPYPWAVDLNL